jgi:hypothetical protein
MSNYLKKILFVFLIFMMPFMNFASKSMDMEDYEGSSVRVRKVSLEDSRNSWKSYLSSSVMSAVQKAYDIVDYTTRNPQKSMIIGVCLAYQFTAVAARCSCFCSNPNTQSTTKVGMMDDSAHCTKWCGLLGMNYAGCL